MNIANQKHTNLNSCEENINIYVSIVSMTNMFIYKPFLSLVHVKKMCHNMKM
jgi:hypothetical protein